MTVISGPARRARVICSAQPTSSRALESCRDPRTGLETSASLPSRNAACCDHYLAQASSVQTLPFEHAGHDAYTAASKTLIDRSELLLAVWDGSTSSGTGEAVAYARAQGREVAVVWPDGAGRN
jgi:hypothetical protein